MLPLWIWLVYIFAFGCCIGSFLNVVIYRMPLDKSLVSPGSFCPACGRHIRFYDNIPLISWLVLRAKCRYCRASISPRYFVIELLTGLVFVGLFVMYFVVNVRHFSIDGQTGLYAFVHGGWLVFLLHIILLSSLIVASAIDLELWVIPIIVCWFATVVALVGSAAAPYIIPPLKFAGNYPLYLAKANLSAAVTGALIGTGLSFLLQAVGIFKESYPEAIVSPGSEKQQGDSEPAEFNHRIEMFKEILFIVPILACSIGAWYLVKKTGMPWWFRFAQHPSVAAVMGSLSGYFAGCAIVWVTRILGTFAFGKEAMGLGDVHLMGAAGAFVGPLPIVVAFFTAPFFGLGWALFQMLSKKVRQIPYGPFLSLGVLIVIIFYDKIIDYWRTLTLAYSS